MKDKKEKEMPMKKEKMPKKKHKKK